MTSEKSMLRIHSSMAEQLGGHDAILICALPSDADLEKTLDGPVSYTLIPVYPDPGAWGLLLCDLVQHIANVYAIDGHMDPVKVQARVWEMVDAERAHPTGRSEFIRGKED